MTIARLQETMFQAIVGEASADDAASLIVSGALGPADRIGIYAEMYWLRMRDTLRSDFPYILKIVGEEDFDVLGARHLRRQPSTHYSLGRFGAGFAETIAEKPIDGALWLSDLAALEWARVESFVAIDAPTLSMASLAQLNEDTFASARLVANPSVRLIRLSHDVLPLWRALELSEGIPTEAVNPAAVHVVVWRSNLEVFHTKIDANEAHALSLVLSHSDMPSICEAFAESDDPIAAAFSAIGSWIGENMMSALEIDGERPAE